MSIKIKLPERFLKADSDCPCESCHKIRKTCRFCEKCKECCDCPICYHCHGAEYPAADWFIKEIGSQCDCEYCDKCGTLISDGLGEVYEITESNKYLCKKCCSPESIP